MSITLELNWQSDVNRYADATNPAKWLPWYLAKALSTSSVSDGNITSGLWTVIASSDGTTADENDNWGQPFDADKIVAANPGDPHSWILLESPSGLTGGPYYMLIDCSHVDHPEAVRIVFTAEAFDLSSLTTENAPVTTDSAAMMEFNTNTRFINSDGVFLAQTPSILQHYAHLRVASTGEFVFNTNYNLQGNFYSHIHFFEIRSTQPSVGAFDGDTKPLQSLAIGGGYVSGKDYNNSTSPLGSNLFSDNNYPNIVIATRNLGALASSAKVFSIPYPLSGVKTQYAVWCAAGGHNEDSPWSYLFYNAATSQLLGLSLTCFSSQSTSTTLISNYRGRVVDVYTAGAYALSVPPSTTVVINQGDVAPIPAVEGDPFLFVKIGAFWFPWNNSATPLI